MISSESSLNSHHIQAICTGHVPLEALHISPYTPPQLPLGVRTAGETGIGGGVTTAKDKERRLFGGDGWRSGGVEGTLFLNAGLPQLS